MKGCLVSVFRRLLMSPRVKINVTAIRKPRIPLVKTPHIKDRGRVMDAS